MSLHWFASTRPTLELQYLVIDPMIGLERGYFLSSPGKWATTTVVTDRLARMKELAALVAAGDYIELTEKPDISSWQKVFTP